MFTILIFPSSVVKQINFFWNWRRVRIGETFYIFLMRLVRWWFQMATWPFFKATTKRKSPKKLSAVIASLCWPNSTVLLTELLLSTSYNTTYLSLPPTAISFSSKEKAIAATRPYSRVLMMILIPVKSWMTSSLAVELVAINLLF